MILYYTLIGFIVFLLFRKKITDIPEGQPGEDKTPVDSLGRFINLLTIIMATPCILMLIRGILLGNNPLFQHRLIEYLFIHAYFFILLSYFLWFYVENRMKAIGSVALAASSAAFLSFSAQNGLLPLTSQPPTDTIELRTLNQTAIYNPDDVLSLQIRTNLLYPVRMTIHRDILWEEGKETERVWTSWAKNAQYTSVILWPFTENLVSIQFNKALCERISIFHSNSYGHSRYWRPCREQTTHTGDYALSYSLSPYFDPKISKGEKQIITNISIRPESITAQYERLPPGWEPTGYYDMYALTTLDDKIREIFETHSEIKELPPVGRNTPRWVLGPKVLYEEESLCGIYTARAPLTGIIKACIELVPENGTHPIYTEADVNVIFDTIDSSNLPSADDLKLSAQEAVFEYMKWRRDTGQPLLSFNLEPKKVQQSILQQNGVRQAIYTFAKAQGNTTIDEGPLHVRVDFERNTCVLPLTYIRDVYTAPCVFETSQE